MAAFFKFLSNPTTLKVVTAIGVAALAGAKQASASGLIDAASVAQIAGAITALATLFHPAPASGK